jgi:broad specificity phosphatase PhoE
LKILLVRHGITKLHESDRFWGKTDIPLSKTGIKQAEKLRDRLAADKIDVIYTSTLRRARVTAEIIASAHKVAVIPCEELCECGFGYIEGLTFEEIKRLHPALAQALIDRRAVDFPGGESIEQLNDRVKNFLQQLERHEPGETVLIIAHGGPIRVMICILLGLGLEHWMQIGIAMASLSIVEMYPDTAILTLLNDVSHLNSNI